MTWQRITSAPKDGSSILAFDPLTNKFNVSTGREPRILVMRWDTSFSDAGQWRTDIHSFVAFDPTHWMPLPQPPETGPMRDLTYAWGSMHQEIVSGLTTLATWVDEANDETIPDHKKIDMQDVDSSMLRRAASAMQELINDAKTHSNAADYWMSQAVEAQNACDRCYDVLAELTELVDEEHQQDSGAYTVFLRARKIVAEATGSNR